MIKFSTQGHNQHLIGLGLSQANVDRLIKGSPIVFDMTPLGIPKTTAMIFYGKTEEAMAEQLSPYFTKDTKFTVSDLKKLVVSTMSGLMLVMAQPLVIPWLGQFLLNRGL